MMQLIVGHFPPNVSGAGRARDECIKLLIDMMSGQHKSVALCDYNVRGSNIGGHSWFVADSVFGEVFGHTIDSAIAVGVRRCLAEYRTSVPGMRLKSDHKHALKFTFWSNFRKWTTYFYNIEVGRHQSDITDEIAAILETKPLALALCETMGYELPEISGYRLVHNRNGTMNQHANVALYVRERRLKNWHYVDGVQTWPRTMYPGEHPPRTFIDARINLRWFKR